MFLLLESFFLFSSCILLTGSAPGCQHSVSRPSSHLPLFLNSCWHLQSILLLIRSRNCLACSVLSPSFSLNCYTSCSPTPCAIPFSLPPSASPSFQPHPISSPPTSSPSASPLQSSPHSSLTPRPPAASRQCQPVHQAPAPGWIEPSLRQERLSSIL